MSSIQKPLRTPNMNISKVSNVSGQSKISKGPTTNGLKKPTISSKLGQPTPTKTSSSSIQNQNKSQIDSPSKVKPIGSHSKISKLRFDDKKSSNPFETKKKNYKTSFSSLYDNNAIPCRIFHATSQMRLQWDKPLDQIPYNPLFIHFSEGLRETVHPYCTIAQAAFKEMCEAEHSAEQIIPILDQVVLHLRTALMDQDSKVFVASLDAVGHLSRVVGDALDPYLDKLLIQIGKRSFQKVYSLKITQLLNQFEEMSGKEEVTKIIKAKIPTYQSVLY